MMWGLPEDRGNETPTAHDAAVSCMLAHPVYHLKEQHVQFVGRESEHDTVLHPVAKIFKEERPRGVLLD